MTEILSEVSSAVGHSQAKARPFVKWAGGKRMLIPAIIERLPDETETYWEPFLGGGAVFFSLVDMFKTAHISDINDKLMLTYKIVKEKVEDLIHRLSEHAEQHAVCGSKYYYEVRNSDEEPLAVDMAARFIFLNKTCYNGLYRVNSKGEFNVPYGKYNNPKILHASNLRAASIALGKANISFCNFFEIRPKLGDFVYCDPPYYGTYANYAAEGFDEEDHRRLRDEVFRWHKLGAKVMISNSDAEYIRDLYSEFNIHEVNGLRSISRNGEDRGSVPELIITTY